MQVPVQITFKGMEPSAALASSIRERVDKLHQFHDRIISCHVTVEAPHRSHNKGKLYRVHIDVGIPRRRLVVAREHGENHAHEDVHMAHRDAFDAMERQLSRAAQKDRGEVKTHQV